MYVTLGNRGEKNSDRKRHVICGPENLVIAGSNTKISPQHICLLSARTQNLQAEKNALHLKFVDLHLKYGKFI